jgi:hypothetical protein
LAIWSKGPKQWLICKLLMIVPLQIRQQICDVAQTIYDGTLDMCTVASDDVSDV